MKGWQMSKRNYDPDHLPESRKKAFAPEVLKEQALKDEAYRLRMAGNSFAEIAKVLDIDGGWKAAYRIIAAEYGELVARLKVNDISGYREPRKAGRAVGGRRGSEDDPSDRGTARAPGGKRGGIRRRRERAERADQHLAPVGAAGWCR